jgi:hypothetical protein
MSHALRRSLTVLVVALAAATLLAPAAEARLRKLYSVSFPVQLNDVGTVLPIKGSSAGYAQAQAIQELHRCFSCSFPVTGAPARYPSNGQFLPLVACAGLVRCWKAPVKAYTSAPNGSFRSLTLVAQNGHFDGAGSLVVFTLSLGLSGELRLNVNAWVAKPTIPDALNRQGAKGMWMRFADRLGTNMWFHQGCKPACTPPGPAPTGG